MMSSRSCATALLCLIAFCQLLSSAYGATVSISGRQIIVNGKPFYARGVCYEPTPRGQWPDSKDAMMSWDWFSTSGVYNRDLTLLKAMNANVIRTYGWRTAVNHSAFLDACYAANIYVIHGFRWNWNSFNTTTGKQQMKANILQDVTTHASHPAILGWAVGNELNTKTGVNVDEVWSFVKEIKDAIHQIEATKNTWHFVGSPLADGSTVHSLMTNKSSSVDVWMAQLYKGKQFWDFFTKYAAASTLPLLITEYGVDSWDSKNNTENEAVQADWVGTLWTELVKANNTNSGGLVFVWTDGWFGCGNIDAHDTCGGNSAAFPDGQGNEEYFGIMSISNTQKATNYVDTLRKKKVYSTLQTLWKGYPVTPRRRRSISDLKRLIHQLYS